jgi:hypothetical protein
MFGLAKVEMLAASIVMAGFWWLWERRRGNPQALWSLLLTGAWLVLLVLPGFFFQGANIKEWIEAWWHLYLPMQSYSLHINSSPPHNLSMITLLNFKQARFKAHTLCSNSSLNIQPTTWII